MQETISNLASSEALSSLATIDFVNNQDNELRVRHSACYSSHSSWIMLLM